MGRSRDGDSPRGGGGPQGVASFPSPSSSSSSDFEFTVSLSPTSKRSSASLCPADELFYKGQLLPLHLSPRISMVRTLLLASASTSSSSDTTTTSSRDSNGSSSSSFSADLSLLPDCDSSRPSSVTEEEARRIAAAAGGPCHKRPKYFAAFANRFSAFFLHRGSKKDATHPLNSHIPPPPPPPPPSSSSSSYTKKTNNSSSLAKEVIKKYVKKVKPLYEKLSSLQQKQNPQNHHQHDQQQQKTFSFSIRREKLKKDCDHDPSATGRRAIYDYSNSFSGNLRQPRRKRWAASCPSSMRSSPSHSGLLFAGGGGVVGAFPDPLVPSSSTVSSMEELQNAIQGAIAHCKSSMIQANQRKASAPVSTSDEICGF